MIDLETVAERLINLINFKLLFFSESDRPLKSDGFCTLDANIAGCNELDADPTSVIAAEDAENSDFCQKRCLAHPDCSKTFFRLDRKVCVYLKDNCSDSPGEGFLKGLFYNCSTKKGELDR